MLRLEVSMPVRLRLLFAGIFFLRFGAALVDFFEP